MADMPRRGFDIFAVSEEVKVNRIGKQVTVRALDNSFVQSETVEANLLFEILKALKRK